MLSYTSAVIGGMLIGTTAVLLLATHGQIMGISGILGKMVPPVATDWLWRASFLFGVLIAPLLYAIFRGGLPSFSLSNNVPLLIVSGLLVGIGAVTANGCTSGHGVCGLSRLSVRSVVAVGVFMFTAFLTVFITRHLLGG